MKISEILHEAADFYLWNGDNRRNRKWDNLYSCCACFDAVERVDYLYANVRHFLTSLGCDGSPEFNEFEFGEERQGARYLWLKFAALVAEDEGL